MLFFMIVVVAVAADNVDVALKNDLETHSNNNKQKSNKLNLHT